MTKKKKVLVVDDASAQTRRLAALAASRSMNTEEVATDEDSEIVLPDMKDLEAEEKLSIFHQKFGGEDYKIRVEKFNKDENEWESVTNLKLAGFDSFDSLKKYGAGRYRMSLLDNGGHYVAGGRMDARISEAAIEAEKKEAAPAPDNGLTAMMTMLQAQNAQNVELLKAMIGRPAPAESKGPSLTELIAAMAGLKNLGPKEESGMGGVKGTLELMKLVKELMPEPAGEDKGGLVAELSQAVELFGKVQPMIEAKRRAQPARLAAPPTAVVAGAVAVPNVEAAPEAEADPMKPIIEKAQSYVPQLVAWASRGKDIEDAAIFVLDEVEAEIVPLVVANYRPGGIKLGNEFVFGELLKKAQDPAQVEAIFTVVPALAPYKEWFTRVIAKAVEIETEAPVEEPNGNAQSA